MDEQTQQFTKPKSDRALGMSLRGIIALFVILTVCLMSVGGVKIEEPLYTLAGMIVAFYYGQNQKQPTPKP